MLPEVQYRGIYDPAKEFSQNFNICEVLTLIPGSGYISEEQKARAVCLR